MIPKRIFTIWISEKEMPELMQKCVKSHDLKGYEHRMITLDDCRYTANRYLQECIKEKKWIKVTDFLRMFLLFYEGGIYLDCDMEILKPFDDLLKNNMFVGREDPNVIANSIIGAEVHHPLLGEYLRMVEDNFRGDGEFIFEPAERLFSDLIIGRYGNFPGITTYSSDYFFPKNEKTGEEKITDNTHIYHHFARSWKK